MGTDLTCAQLLREDVDRWNRWRDSHRDGCVDLSHANLNGLDLRGARLYNAQLMHASLENARLGHANFINSNLVRAKLCGAKLHGANLRGANLSEADLSGADLTGAKLFGTVLWRANLQGATLRNVELDCAVLTHARLEGATLEGCSVYGISAWDLHLDDTHQSNLHIRPDPDEETGLEAKENLDITVDNLEVAQFLYLVLDRKKMGGTLGALANRMVLILGPFSDGRKPVLERIRVQLRKHPANNYIPVIFDFPGPQTRDVIETVTLLARLSRFIIADITEAAMVRVELALMVRDLPSVPIQPIISATSGEFYEFKHLVRFPWVLPLQRYRDEAELCATLEEKVINPAEAWIKAHEQQEA